MRRCPICGTAPGSTGGTSSSASPELPLRGADGRYLAVESDESTGTGVLSVPALGGVRVRGRARGELERLLGRMTAGERHQDPGGDRGGDRGGAPARTVGRARLLLGMTLANRPWRLVPGLRSALVAALATGAIATINSTVWLLAGSPSTWRMLVATLLSVILVVGWLIVDGELWDRPGENSGEDSAEARERSRLYNAATVLTLSAGAVLCYGALYVVNLAWGFFVLDPSVMGEYVRLPLDHGDLFLLAWFVTSAATVGGALGSGLETNEAIRAATYSQREQERRRRLSED